MYDLRGIEALTPGPLEDVVASLVRHITSFVNLVGSASLPLPEVCAMQGLPGTACRTEGHREARLFPASEPLDRAEELIEESTRTLFRLDESYAINAQPHSATQANHAVFRAVLQDCDRPIAGLAPTDGGHISHLLGAQSSPFVPFPLARTGIDYDELERVVTRCQPALIVAGGTSYTRAMDYRRLREIADRVGCHLHADLAHMAPFVATGAHPPAFPFADSATIDSSKNFLGPRGGILIYRKADASRMRRAIFPIVQSSPNQNGLLGKAACLDHWVRRGLDDYCKKMVSLARTLGERVGRHLGFPVYGGTDSHLILFDVSRFGWNGREAESALEQDRILVNRNQVPGDAGTAWRPSGVRLGTTVLATLDYSEEDVRDLADEIGSVLRGGGANPDTTERLLNKYHRHLVLGASHVPELVGDCGLARPV